MLPGKKYRPKEIFWILLRRRWLLMLPVALGLTAAAVTATAVPEQHPSDSVPAVASSDPEKQVAAAPSLPFVIGGFGGLAFGLALIAWLEYRNSSFASAEDVIRVLSVPVRVIPVMTSERERRMQRYRRAAVDLGGSVMLAAMVLIVWRLRS